MNNKDSARYVTTKVIASGKLLRPDLCGECGIPAAVEAHHIDYDNPDKILWLCNPCHREIHGATNVFRPPPLLKMRSLTDLEMDKKIKSLNAQFRYGTIERNTIIALRALGGEPQVALAREFDITKQMVNKIVKRHKVNNAKS